MTDMHRRAYLATVLTALTGVGTAVTPASGHTSTTAAEEPTNEYVQGESDVELTVHKEEDDEHVEYIEEDDEVEFVAVMSGDEPVRYETTAWERWGEMRTTRAAREKAAEYVDGELDVRVGGGITSRVEGQDIAAFVSVSAEEDVTLDELVGVTPSTVEVTYELDGRTFEMDVPIYATLRSEVVSDFGWTIDTNNATDLGGDDDESEDDRSENNDSDDNGGGSDDDSDNGDNTDSDDNGDDNDSDNGDDSDDGFGPGFGVGGALAALGGAYVLRRQRLGERGTDH